MPFVITFLDDPDLSDIRERKQKARPDHIAYVGRNADRILASGGFFPDDDDFPNGGLIVIDVETRQEAVDYIENDPFRKAGVFKDYAIRRWKKFVWDGVRV